MRKVKLQNLDCPTCALKIENCLNSMQNLSNVKLNFATSTLTFEQNTEDNLLDIIEQEIQKIEKDVYIIKDEKFVKKSFWELLDKKLLLLTLISLLITYISYNYIENTYLQFIIYIFAYLLVGFDVLNMAFKNIKAKKIFDEYFLMSIATIGALCLGEFVEAVAVMIFYQIGEMFQNVAVKKSKDSINSLIDIKPEFANVKLNDEIVKKDVEDVDIGDIILVKAGEKVAVDSILLEDEAYFDTSAVTGEFKPKTFRKNDEILSGYINISSAVYLKANTLYKDSTISKIIELIENSSLQKAKAEKFITKFATVYTPIVVVLALLLAFIPPLIIENATFSSWIERALVFLVISCPCALVISVPLSYFSAIGAVSRKGVLVKGANYLEELSLIKNIVFDKTGTLTKGVFEVTKIESFDLNKDEFLKYVATVESLSNHPIATAIVKSYTNKINLEDVTFCEELSGLGMRAKFLQKDILIGNKKLLDKFEVKITQDIKESSNIIYVAIDLKFVGYILLSDIIKLEAKEFIQNLRNLGVEKTFMLTGDKKELALSVAKSVGIDEVKYELLPKDKLSSYQDIKKSRKNVAFVGDGINDAPTLKTADIGIAMGAIGSDLAIKSADVIVLNDNLNAIKDAIKISKKTKTIVIQNIVFIMLVKVSFLLLGANAIIGMQEAIFADVGVALLAILNSMRILKI